MTKKITIGLIQMKCEADSRKNLDKAIIKIKQAAKKGAKIICLPELFLSKYFCQGRDKKYFASAEPIPGKTTAILSKVAQETGASIIVSLFEKTPKGKFYNSTVLVGSNGKIVGKYRKIHIPSLPPGLYDEDFYFDKGDLGLPVFETQGIKIGIPICYDQWFPEVARALVVAGAQIIFYPTAIGWPSADSREKNLAEYQAWQTIQRSHSIANNVFVAATNRVGREKNLKFWGTSFVSDPYGRVLKQASTNKEEILIATCDLSIIDSMRREWAFLDERQIHFKKPL